MDLVVIPGLKQDPGFYNRTCSQFLGSRLHDTNSANGSTPEARRERCCSSFSLLQGNLDLIQSIDGQTHSSEGKMRGSEGEWTGS